MGVYLAVDAEGTKTECLIADEQRVLARVTGESVTLGSVGATEATLRIHRLMQGASAEAGVPLYLVNRACLGLAGITTEGVRTWAEAALRELLAGELVLTGREEIALEAAFGQAAGVMIVAGTSAVVVGRCANKSRFTAGGWGALLGDEGSAHWIGLEGIRTGLRALDRGLGSSLLREIQATCETPHLGALVAWVNGRTPPDFSELASVVARCAAGGDSLARTVLQRAGEELSAPMAVVLGKMRAASCRPADLQRIAFTGSVLTEIPPVREAMVASLQRTAPGSVVDERPTDALLGALARARRP